MEAELKTYEDERQITKGGREKQRGKQKKRKRQETSNAKKESEK